MRFFICFFFIAMFLTRFLSVCFFAGMARLATRVGSHTMGKVVFIDRTVID